MSDDLCFLSARSMLAAYRDKRLSPVEVVSALLERIERFDGAVNSFCFLAPEAALAEAKESEARWAAGTPKGRLDGVPVGHKDLLLTRGWPTLRGSLTVDEAGPWDMDAPSTERMREHGAILLGKTTTPEFGWKGVTDSARHGVTRNPWNLETTPGGSSGGASAALAAGFCPLATGTDGGGSIRIPAAFAGVYGLKPSFGRVPAFPISPFGTVAHVGPMARTVDDAALFLSVLSEADARDWYAQPAPTADYAALCDQAPEACAASLKGKRIAYSPTLGYARVDAEVAALTEQAVKRLADAGAHVEEVDPGFQDPQEIFRVLWWSGAGFALNDLKAEDRAKLDPGLRQVVEESAAIDRITYMSAVKAREQLGSHMRVFMERYDALVTPALSVPAFKAGQVAPEGWDAEQWLEWTPFSFPFNLTQQPAASVPCGFTRAGLPVGLHIVGPMFDDAGVLALSAGYEALHPLFDRHPDLEAGKGPALSL